MTVSESMIGMVLSAMPVGDYDKRLVLLTKEKGKICVFAKGARKPKSPLLACSQPFSFGTFVLYEGRSAYNLIQAEISNYFVNMRENLDKIYYGFYFLELSDYFSRENIDGTQILKLLYQSCKALEKENFSVLLIRSIFELKIMSQEGIAPFLFQCMKCGKKEELSYFSVRRGGVFCLACKDKEKDNIKISASTLYTMQFIISSPVEKLYTFTVSQKVLDELRKCISGYRKEYIEGTFKSLELLDSTK